MLPNLTMEVKTDPLNKAFPQKRRYFSTIEKKCLVTCYEKFKHILELKSTTACSNQKKNEAWDSLTELFNSMPNVTESHASTSKQQLKDLYKNLKRTARKQDVGIMTLLENGDPMGVSLDSTALLDGCDLTDKTLLEVVPLSCPLDSDSIIKSIKCEVIEDDHNASCDMSSNCSDCVVTSSPHEKSQKKRAVDVIENGSNSPGCAVTSTPSEEIINQKVLDILKNSINTASPATPYEEESNDEQQIDGPISSSHPTSTTTPAEENLITSYKKKRKEPASVKAAYALHNQSVTRLKQLEEEHELIKKKLRLEITYQINSEKRAKAQHRLMIGRIKREDEQSEKLQAAKLRALEAKARYFESKMGAL